MSAGRRLGLLAALLLALVGAGVGGATVASAHASLQRSTPTDGAVLDSPPDRIELTFTEPPDLGLTSVTVVSSSGASVPTGPVAAGDDDRTVVVRPQGRLADGVYTVSWRTVSTTDGHVTANAFTFGVGVQPGDVSSAPTAPGEETPNPSVLSVLGRVALYVGLAVLLGAGLAGPLALGVGRVGRPVVLVGAWIASALGVVAMTLAERTSVGISLGALLSSDTGAAFVRLGVAVLVLAVAVGVASARPTTVTMLVLAAVVAAAMLVRAEGGHAGGSLLELLLQWLHLVGVGVWIGGLAWLLLSLLGRRVEPSAVRRFSNLAAVGLSVVAVTGLLRATNELGSITWWLHPSRNGYATTLALKVVAFVPLVALGAANRFRNVPSYERRGARPLVRAAAGEIALALGVFALTGVLTGLPPKSPPAAGTKAPGPLVVTGADFATTTRVRLAIAPGTVGANSFVADVRDYDSGRPLDATAVSLRFDLPGRPEISSTLDLERGDRGAWEAGGTNLSVNGTWNLTALVESASGSVEVPLRVTPRPPQQSISVSRTPGQPDLYTITVQDGLQIQAYVDPGTPGRTNQLHVTAFDADGQELPLRSATISLGPPQGEATTPDLVRFGPGHFVANFDLTPGRWTFAITAEARDGRSLIASFARTFGS